MLSNNPVLPNFVKTLCVAIAATFSISAFAGHHEKAEEKIGDLKEMSHSKEAGKHADKHMMKKEQGDLSYDEIKAKMDKAEMEAEAGIEAEADTEAPE